MFFSMNSLQKKNRKFFTVNFIEKKFENFLQKIRKKKFLLEKKGFTGGKSEQCFQKN